LTGVGQDGPDGRTLPARRPRRSAPSAAGSHSDHSASGRSS